MCPIEWHQCQWPWMTLKVTVAVWNLKLNLSNSHTAVSVICLHMNWKVHVACDFNFSKLNDFSVSQAVTYAVNVVIYRKQCESLLQTTVNVIYGLLNNRNSIVREWPSWSFTYCKRFQMWFFIQLCSSWQDVNSHSASRGPSAIAELLFIIVQLYCLRKIFIGIFYSNLVYARIYQRFSWEL